jgi:hypothetical protein
MTDMTCRQHASRFVLQMAGLVLLSACFTSAIAQTLPLTPATSTSGATPVAVSQSWQQLTPRQKQALAPLGAQWSALSAQQQSKWLAISQNFSQLSVSEQITMHARMADWVALSPQQRNLARFNYNTVQSLPKEDKKAKWEAYQALSAEEKRQLSAVVQSPAKSGAPTAKPVEPHRLVQTPQRPVDATRDTARPNPSAIDRKTLLPRPPAMVAPASTSPASEAVSPNTTRNATETSPS